MRKNNALFAVALLFAMFLTAAAGHAQAYTTPATATNTAATTAPAAQVVSSYNDGLQTITTYSDGTEVIKPNQIAEPTVYSDDNVYIPTEAPILPVVVNENWNEWAATHWTATSEEGDEE